MLRVIAVLNEYMFLILIFKLTNEREGVARHRRHNQGPPTWPNGVGPQVVSRR